VKTIIPIIIIKIPLILDIIGKYFEKFLYYLVKLSIAITVKIKGTARPREYITRSNTHLPIELILAA
jgi:hypothetical protein